METKEKTIRGERPQITNVTELYRAEDLGQIKKLHTSYYMGYVSRRGGPRIEPYKGKFGEGVKLLSCNYDSTRYSYVTYYVYTE